MSDVLIRQAEPHDVHAVRQLLLSHRLPLEGADRHFAEFAVAVDGSTVIGCAGAELYGASALLRSVAVTPAWQRMGVGRQLVRHLLNGVRRRNVRTVYLLTTTASDYFAALGFRTVDRADAPLPLKASSQFHSACPADAALMALGLAPVP